MTQELHDRIDRLEAHVAEQDRVLQDMSDVMARQWSSLDLMTARIERLLERIGALEAARDEPDDRPPPHY